jgi:hypothetical protein
MHVNDSDRSRTNHHVTFVFCVAVTGMNISRLADHFATLLI